MFHSVYFHMFAQQTSSPARCCAQHCMSQSQPLLRFGTEDARDTRTTTMCFYHPGACNGSWCTTQVISIDRVWAGKRIPTQPKAPSSGSRQSLGLGPKPGTFLGFKDIATIWKREHYQSPCWMASVIIIFISIKGVLWQGSVQFNLVWIRTQQGYIFYFCPGLNLSWIIQCLSTSKDQASTPPSSRTALFRVPWLLVSPKTHIPTSGCQ